MKVVMYIYTERDIYEVLKFHGNDSSNFEISTSLF